MNVAPMKKLWSMAPMKYSLNEKGIMAPMQYTNMAYSTKEKGIVLWNFLFRSVKVHGNRYTV